MGALYLAKNKLIIKCNEQFFDFHRLVRKRAIPCTFLRDLFLLRKISSKICWISEFLLKIKMEDKDIIFNLRIANQKLDEELHLYRNGTTEEDLLDHISEKDTEIEELKKQNSDSKDKLRRIARSAGEMLEKNKSLEKENVRLQKLTATANSKLSDTMNQMHETDKNDTEKKLADSQREISSLEMKLVVAQDKLRKFQQANKMLQDDCEEQLAKAKEEAESFRKENEALNNSIDLLIPEAEQFQQLIEILQDDACSRDTSIERLQKRCGQLIQDSKIVSSLKKQLDKSERENKKLTERKNKQLAQYHAELEKAQKFNGQLKDRIANEKQENNNLSVQLLERLGNIEIMKGGEDNRSAVKKTKEDKEKGLKERNLNICIKTNAAAAITSKARRMDLKLIKPGSSKKLTFRE